MKALLIILGCLALAVLLRILDACTSRRRIPSVGTRANGKSRGMARIDLNDRTAVQEILARYKDLDD